MAEAISADFVRQVRLALEVLAGENAMSPTNELSALVGGGSEAFFQATMNDQTTDLLFNDHVEFDNQLANDGGGFITLASGGGDQTDGIITLAAGKKYLCMAGMNCIFSSAAGIARFQWHFTGPGPFLDGSIAEVQPATFTLDRGKTTVAMAFADLVAGPQRTAQVRIIGVSGLTSILGAGGSTGSTFALIHEF